MDNFKLRFAENGQPLFYIPETYETGYAVIGDFYNDGEFLNLSTFVEATQAGFDEVPETILKWAEKTAKACAKEHNQPSEGYALPLIRACKAGITKNYNIYSVENLRGMGMKDMEGNRDGIHSWTMPFPKPILQDHIVSGAGGLFTPQSDPVTPLGRTHYAIFSNEDNCSYIMPKITNYSAISSLREGRFLTGSIGSSVVNIKCNICGKSIGYACEDHVLGQSYKSDISGEKEIAGRAFDALWHSEYSFVNNPANSMSGVVRLMDPEPRESASQGHTNIEAFCKENSNLPMESVSEVNKLLEKAIKTIEWHDKIHSLYDRTKNSGLVKEHRKTVLELRQLALNISIMTNCKEIALHVFNKNEDLDNDLPKSLRNKE